MHNVCNVLLLLGCLCALAQLHQIDASRATHVTCGSVLKLQNTDYRVRLHSHDVKYGTGSGQQSVTGTELQEDSNSHWTVLGALGTQCLRGTVLKCGDRLRLQHLATKRFLHSHHFQSPLSGNQEISAYGEDGVGDTGDNWELMCSSGEWRRDQPIKLRHIDTGAYLAVSGRTFGRPINGQMEVIGQMSAGQASDWKSAEGLFVHEREQTAGEAHDEL